MASFGYSKFNGNFYVFYALAVQLYNMDNDCIRAILNKIRAIILE